MKKRLSAIIMLAVIMLNLCMVNIPTTAAAATNNSKQLMVLGNKLVYADDPGTVVRLTGVNVPGGEWTGTPGAERLMESTREAINNWNSNVIRLATGIEGWYGDYSYVNDGGRGYRNYIDQVINYASEAGIYVVLDLHHYKGFNNTKYLNFWREAGAKYANNPTVLFGILNEPHGISWETWRNGDATYKGHQYVVEMIRDMGAKNIIVAGGLDWAYDLTGIANNYALVDQGSDGDKSKTGYGIMYDTHIYPWKGLTANWHSKVGAARMKYPILVGENGWDPATNSAVGKKVYQPGSDYYHDRWCPSLFSWMNDVETYGNYANYTAYSFHPSSAPRILVSPDNKGVRFGESGYSYQPTDFWGVYVKAALEADEKTRYSPLGKPDNISIINPKRVYQVGEPFDAAQGHLFVKFENSELEIDLDNPNITVEGFNTEKAAEVLVVTIKYLGAETQYSIKVKDITGSATPTEENIFKKHLLLDFEDAVVSSAETDTDYGLLAYVNTTNKADNTVYNAKTYRNAKYFPSVGTDSTNYLQIGKRVSHRFDMPKALGAEDELIYVDFRLGRNTNTYEGGFDVDFLDSTQKKLFGINFASNETAPTLTADEIYETTYPADAERRCIRAIINVNSKTFELYQGESFDDLTAFSATKNSFVFADVTAENFACISNRDSTHMASQSFDDISVYTVKVEAESVPNVQRTEVLGAQTEYDMGDDFNRALGNLMIYFTDGTIDYAPLNSNDVTVSGYDCDKSGKQTIDIEWNGIRAQYDIQVNYKNYLKSISLKDVITKYLKNSDFNYRGTLVSHYFEGNTDEQSFDLSGAIEDGFDSTTLGEKTITVSYNDFYTTYTIEVVDDYTADAVSIEAEDYITEYKMGDSFNNAKGNVIVNFADGAIGCIPLNDRSVNVYGYDTDIEGDQTITVEYGGKSDTFVINNKYNVYLKGITVDGVKTEYSVGDAFDYLTGTVMLMYSDGTQKPLALNEKGVTIKGFDSSKAGNITVTVSYLAFSKEYEVTVSKILSSITAHDFKTVYEKGEEFDYQSGYITAKYNDGSTETIHFDDSRVQIARFNTSKTGTVAIMFVVSNSGLTQRFNTSITVVEPANPYRIAVKDLVKSDEISGKITITQTGEASLTGMLVVLAVDSNNCLKAVQLIDVDFANLRQEYAIALCGTDSLEGTTFKAFLWNGKMEPISNILK